MSVTFWMPQAPVQKTVPYEDEPDFVVTEPVPPFLEINLANSNARDILRLIDPTRSYEDLCGTWEQEDLARVRSNVVRVLNSRAKDSLVVPAFVETGNGCCTMVVCGRDDEYVSRRLNQFLGLTKVAMDHQFTVVFA